VLVSCSISLFIAGAAASEGLADIEMSSPVPAEATATLRAATPGAPRRASEGCPKHGMRGAAVSEALADGDIERSRGIIDKCHVSKIAWPRPNAQGTQTAITHLRVYEANARGKQTALTHVWVYVKTYRTSIQIYKKINKIYILTYRNLDFQTAYLGQTAYIA